MHNYTVHFYANEFLSDGRSKAASVDLKSTSPTDAAREALKQIGEERVTGIRNICVQDAGGNMISLDINTSAIYNKVKTQIA